MGNDRGNKEIYKEINVNDYYLQKYIKIIKNIKKLYKYNIYIFIIYL